MAFKFSLQMTLSKSTLFLEPYQLLNDNMYCQFLQNMFNFVTGSSFSTYFYESFVLHRLYQKSIIAPSDGQTNIAPFVCFLQCAFFIGYVICKLLLSDFVRQHFGIVHDRFVQNIKILEYPNAWSGRFDISFMLFIHLSFRHSFSFTKKNTLGLGEILR